MILGFNLTERLIQLENHGKEDQEVKDGHEREEQLKERYERRTREEDSVSFQDWPFFCIIVRDIRSSLKDSCLFHPTLHSWIERLLRQKHLLPEKLT